MNTGTCKGLDAQSWKDLYQIAMCESDGNKLSDRIADAEAAIVLRARSCSTHLGTARRAGKFGRCIVHPSCATYFIEAQTDRCSSDE